MLFLLVERVLCKTVLRTRYTCINFPLKTSRHGKYFRLSERDFVMLVLISEWINLLSNIKGRILSVSVQFAFFDIVIYKRVISIVKLLYIRIFFFFFYSLTGLKASWKVSKRIRYPGVADGQGMCVLADHCRLFDTRSRAFHLPDKKSSGKRSRHHPVRRRRIDNPSRIASLSRNFPWWQIKILKLM